MSTTEDDATKAAAAAATTDDAKMEDTTADAVAATKAVAASTDTIDDNNAVGTTEATLAAAAAAAGAVVEVPQAEGEAPAAPTPQEAAGGIQLAQEQSVNVSGRVSLLSDVDGQGKRRFFPRVKHLIGNKEWEDFLTQVLQCIEEAGAPETAAASHKANNAWYKAFDLIYGGVAREYSIPTGKNRYHKFKDKVLEVWVALESQVPGENHCRELAMDQYERYKRACSEANKTGSHGSGALAGSGSGVHGNKVSKIGAGQTPGSASYKLAGGKRSYSTAMGGGASLPSAGSHSHGLWKNLDEKAVLESLPVTLRSLVHLKQLSKEMAAGTANRAARRGIEEHSKKLDGAYLEALTEYLKDGSDEEEQAAKEGDNGKIKEEESPDVEMDEGNGEAAPAEAATESSPNGGDDDKANGEIESSYDRCLAVAFLYRYASTLHEQRVLADAYARCTKKCVTFAKEEPAAVAVAPAPAADSTTATEEAAVVTEAESDEATAAAAAAAAMEENPAFSVQI